MKIYALATVLAGGAALVSAQSASPAASLSINPSNNVISCTNGDGSVFSGSVCSGPDAIVSCVNGVGTPLAFSNTTAFPTPTGTTPTVSPTCYQKDGNNAYPAYDNTVYESSTTYTFSESSSTSSSSSTGSSTSMPPITDVVLSTQIVTITSCHPTVTNCPASMATYTSLSQSVVTITAVIVSDTTYCPEAEATPTPPSYVNVPIAVQPPPSPSPEAPSPSPEAAEIPMSPEAPEQTETPVSSGCPGGCEVYEVVPTVYVIPTPFYAAGNTTSTSPTGAGSPSPSFNANGASTNEIGVLAAAAGLVLAALF